MPIDLARLDILAAELTEAGVDQPLLLSAAFAEAARAERWRLVSVGRYAPRGVGRPQELFTLDPEETA